MNKKLKNSLIILNVIMLGVALYWVYKESQPEPIIVIIGQLATLLTLIFEGKATKLITEEISDNSEVNVEVNRGTNATTRKIENSKVTVKTK